MPASAPDVPRLSGFRARRRPTAAVVVLAAIACSGLGARPAAADRVAVRVEGDGRAARLVLSWPQPVNHQAALADGRLTLRFERPIEADLAALEGIGRLVDQPRIEAAATVLSLRLAPGVTALAHGDGQDVIVDLIGASPPPAGRTKPAAPAEALPATAAAFDLPGRRQRTPLPRPVDGPPPAAATSQPEALAATPPSLPAGQARLRFDWGAPTAAALVRRGETAWLAFDRPSAPDLAALAVVAKGALRGIDAQPDAEATVLTLRLADGVHPQLAQDGTAWSLLLGASAPRPPDPVTLSVTPAASAQDHGARAVLQASVGRTAIRVRDFDAQHALVLVPLRTAASGMPDARAFPEFRLAPTLQGLAIQPLADALHVALGDDFVAIGRSDGLQLTAPAAVSAQAAAAPVRPPRLLFPVVAEPAGADDAPLPPDAGRSFAERRRALERASAEGFGIGREQARLALCELFLEHGFAVECLGLIELIGADRAAARDERRVRFLRGAANLLVGRFAAARADLNEPSLAAGDEAGLWRTALAALEGGAGGSLPAGSVEGWLAMLKAYPPPVRFALARTLAEQALDQGALADARRLVEVTAGAAATARERAWLPYLEGRLLARQGKADKARAVWDAATAAPTHPAHARQRYARVDLDLKLKKIDTRQAIAALQPLRDAWRGDAFEFQVLRRLGRLQIEAGDYALGLRNLNEAAHGFPALPEAAAIGREVAQTFERLAAGDLADKVPPLAAIALLDDFAALIPAGEPGRALRRRQADRLIGVDLLPEAAAVLEDLVAGTPAGAERAADGLRLAEAYVDDGKPDQALAALQRSAADGLPAALAVARRRATARALAALDRGGEALAAIAGDNDDDSRRLRTRILRGAQDWAGTAASLGAGLGAGPAAPLAGDAGTAKATAGAPAADAVLDLAAALALADDRDAAARLRREHGATMAASSAAGAFEVLTGGLPPPGADVDALKAYVDEAAAVRQLLGPPPTTPPPTTTPATTPPPTTPAASR